MKLHTILGTVAIALSAGSAWAECSLDPAPAVPNGSTADKETFFAGYEQTKAYLKDADAYLTCLTEEETAEVQAGTATEETSAARVATYNTTVDQMQATGDSLNVQVRAFKARGIE
jgi:hypothetical protein